MGCRWAAVDHVDPVVEIIPSRADWSCFDENAGLNRPGSLVNKQINRLIKQRSYQMPPPPPLQSLNVVLGVLVLYLFLGFPLFAIIFQFFVRIIDVTVSYSNNLLSKKGPVEKGNQSADQFNVFCF